MRPFHFCLSAAKKLSSFQLLLASLIADLLQLFLGLPLFLFPWGFQSRAAFDISPSSFLNVWPIHLNFLFRISTFISSCSVTFHRSMLEIIFGHHILNIYLRHLFTYKYIYIYIYKTDEKFSDFLNIKGHVLWNQAWCSYQNIATHCLPRHNIIWYTTYWACLPFFVNTVPVLAGWLVETQGLQYKERSTSYACVEIKKLIKFLNWPVKTLGETWVIDLGHTVTHVASRRGLSQRRPGFCQGPVHVKPEMEKVSVSDVMLNQELTTSLKVGHWQATAYNFLKP